MPPIRVLIADDEPLLLEALGEVIDSSPHFEIVATAANAADATRLAGDLRPQVALLDVRMPDGGGIAAAKGIRTTSPATRVVALSAYEDEARVRAMRGAGAVDYVVKGSPAAAILGALLKAADA
ncbi:MAG TPA: response regulator transcription factor [Gaiellales bacterium]|nr:response regulator transcription factor [Gaiellales bacterium]